MTQPSVAPPDPSGMVEARLVTTLGPLAASEVAAILPHEHLLAHFGPGAEALATSAKADQVIRVMGPALRAAARVGVGAIVEATAVGGGRRADILQALSASTGMPLVLATGVFREPYITERTLVGERALRDWMVSELTNGIDDTGARAGWIKIRSGDDRLTDGQRTLVRAAGSAATATNATVGSHTVRGVVARDQLDLLEAVGCSPGRFIWIHAQDEPDFSLHLDLARRGVWLEYDGIDSEHPDTFYIRLVLRALEAGYGNQILLSHDRRGFDPGAPHNTTPAGYTYITEGFLPALARAGVSEPQLSRLMSDNPYRAYAR